MDLAAGPLDTVEKRCQRANKASGFGHTRAICEKDIIMQILPVSLQRATYKCIPEVLQYRGAETACMAIDVPVLLSPRPAFQQSETGGPF